MINYKFFIASLVFIAGYSAQAQFITGDTENRSSILNQPTSVGVDIADEKLNFEFNNIHGQAARENKLLSGLKYSGGNSQGISKVFKGGDFVFGSEFSGFLAYSTLLKDSNIKSFEDSIRINGKLAEELKESLTKAIDSNFQKKLLEFSIEKQGILKLLLFNDSTKKSIDDLKYFENMLVNSSGSELKDTSYRKFLYSQKFTKVEIDSYKDFIIESLKKYDTSLLNGDYQKYQKVIFMYESKKANYENNQGTRRFSVFFRGGLNGKKFNLIDSLSSGDLKFNEIEFRGGFTEIGANLLLKGRYYIGISYLHDWVDNLSDLEETEFSITRQDTINNEIFQFKETKNAFIGEQYREFEKNILYIDFAATFPFKDESTLMLSPYFRRNWVIDNSKLEDTSDLGISLNWHKNDGNFLFGIFLESPDTGNANDNDGNIFDRLSFGFRTNYSFNTLVGLTR